MPSFVLHPLFAGRVVSTDIAKKMPGALRGTAEAVPYVQTVAPLSTLPVEQVASLIDLIKRAGGSLEDSEAPFVR